MLKRYLSWMAVAAMGLGLALAGAPAHAQAQPGKGGGPQAGVPRGRMGMSPEEQLERLSKALNLTDDQKGQIKPILAERHEKMAKLRADESLSQEDRRAKMREIFEGSNKKIRDVLNEDQKKIFDEMQERQRERMQQRSGTEKK
jgi:periplasmic protein CpxP/Spy